jgi:hypothetical protein
MTSSQPEESIRDRVGNRHMRQRQTKGVFGQIILILGAVVQLAVIAGAVFYATKLIVHAF